MLQARKFLAFPTISIQIGKDNYPSHSLKSISSNSAPIIVMRLSYFLAGCPCTVMGVYRFAGCWRVVQTSLQAASMSRPMTIMSARRLARSMSLEPSTSTVRAEAVSWRGGTGVPKQLFSG